MAVHRINLKGPWEYTWVTPADSGAGRVHQPATWESVHGDAAGTVRWIRRFGLPTNLESDDRVLISFEAIGGAARISLGDHALGEVEDARDLQFEITPLLERRNEVRVEVTFDPSDATTPGGLHGVVSLEIVTADE